MRSGSAVASPGRELRGAELLALKRLDRGTSDCIALGPGTATAWLSSTGDCSVGVRVRVAVEAEDVNGTKLEAELIGETGFEPCDDVGTDWPEESLACDDGSLFVSSVAGVGNCGASGTGKTGTAGAGAGATDVDAGSDGICEAGAAGIEDCAVAIRDCVAMSANECAAAAGSPGDAGPVAVVTGEVPGALEVLEASVISLGSG